jgi:hypothetical protein
MLCRLALPKRQEAAAKARQLRRAQPHLGKLEGSLHFLHVFARLALEMAQVFRMRLRPCAAWTDTDLPANNKKACETAISQALTSKTCCLAATAFGRCSPPAPAALAFQDELCAIRMPIPIRSPISEEKR